MKQIQGFLCVIFWIFLSNVFNLLLVESTDEKPTDREGQLCVYVVVFHTYSQTNLTQ